MELTPAERQALLGIYGASTPDRVLRAMDWFRKLNRTIGLPEALTQREIFLLVALHETSTEAQAPEPEQAVIPHVRRMGRPPKYAKA